MTMFDISLSLVYLGSSAYAVYVGYRKPFIVLALILALVFQYILDFSAIAKIAAAVIFFIYFVVPSIINLSSLKPQGEDSPFTAPPPSGGSSAPNESSYQSVFQDFKNFTKAQKSGGRTTSTGGGQTQGGTGRSRRQKSSSTNSSSTSQKTASSKKYSHRQSRSSKRRRPDPKVQHLQNAVHELARDKDELAQKAKLNEEKYLLAEDKLKAERQVSQRHQAEILKLQNRRVSDNRTPEEVLGVKSNPYTAQELRDAWIRESKRWHTSSMVNKPDELVRLAEEELKRVNLAYETLKKRLKTAGN